jgi:2-polyprenyl-3-methyl-5-hydroxy-6-metoxy-1,4-benzoquinol methylase
MMGYSITGDANTWDEISDWWVKYLEDSDVAEYIDIIFPVAETFLSDKQRILDIGTGTGLVARHLKKATKGATIIGSDVSSKQLRHARKLSNGIHFIQHDIEKVPFKNEAFDGVFCSMVLEHVQSLHGAVGEIARIIEKNGVLLLVMNHPVFQTPGSGPIQANPLEEQSHWGIADYLFESSQIEEVDSNIYVQYEHRTLATYFNAISNENLMIENVIEKSIDHAQPDIPALLIMLCRKV